MTTQATRKISYVSPKLMTYGSVRNLTGGSGGTDNDGGGLMTALLNGGGM